MKLLEQILEEAGAETFKSFTVVPSFGGYFRCVKSIAEYSREKIILIIRKQALTIEGENLLIEKYFEQDIFIKGDIKVIKID